MQSIATVEGYIKSQDHKVQIILNKLRQIIKTNSPESTESISYGMPGYKLNGKPLIYFGAFKNHIGIYPTPSGISAFQKDLATYKSAKGSVQYPLDSPFPYDIFEKILKYKILENKGAI